MSGSWCDTHATHAPAGVCIACLREHDRAASDLAALAEYARCRAIPAAEVADEDGDAVTGVVVPAPVRRGFLGSLRARVVDGVAEWL